MKSFNSITFFALFLVLCAAFVNATSLIGVPIPLQPCSKTNSTSQPCFLDTLGKNSVYVKVILINPVGSVLDQDLLDLVVKAQVLGIQVFARVDVDFGKRSLVDVKAFIDLCVNLYKIDGIFFDSVPTDCSCQTYFSDLYAYVRVKVAGLVALNVKVNVPECFALFADILVVVDLPLNEYLNYVPLPWFKKYPASTFWHVVRSCPPEQQKTVLIKANVLGAGLVYVTADVDLSLGSGNLLTVNLDLLVRLCKLLNLDLFLKLKA